MDELAAGQARRFDVAGLRVALVRIDDDFYAVGDRCSHEDFSLADGEVWADECEIECAKHGSTFDLRTGEPVLPARHPAGPRLRGAGRRRTRCRWWSRERRASCVIEGLRAGVPGREILQGVSLTVRSGEVHAVMGPNGSGKSTLAHVLMGRPGYEVLGGTVTLDGVDLLGLPTWQRARAGLFLAMQHPIEVPGVSCSRRCWPRPADGPVGGPVRRPRRTDCGPRPAASASTSGSCDRPAQRGPVGWRAQAERDGPAGGACGRRFAVLDEIDSGLDVDALAAVGRRVQEATAEWGLGVLAITHFRRLLDVLRPDVVHVLTEGRVVATGGPELAEIVDRTGYAAYR